MKTSDFSKHLTNYLLTYLPGLKGTSSNTLKSYADTFRLLLIYCRDERKISPERIMLRNLNSDLITQFLDWLENERNNSVSTRNQRLAAIQAFCRYLQTEEPAYMAIMQNNLNVPRKKYSKPQLGYLSMNEMTKILAKPNLSQASGRRDLAIISLLYDSGARVSELVDLRVKDLRLDEFPTITLYGKGRKIRYVPIMRKTSEILKKYILENNFDNAESLSNPLFINRQKQKLTRAGVTYILKKYTDDKTITPHILRHTKAMHLLQAGVNIVYIRDILGHASIETTNVYARADTEMKRKAIENIAEEALPHIPDWSSDNALMEWLKQLG